jgi:succinate dehydrogenase / fumarate reductase iron-sulfur subunit
MNVISCLQEIQKNPVTADGKKTTPVVWDSNCLEEVCGACSMLVNGKPRQSCSTLVDKLIGSPADTIVLTPLTKFPVVRDLAVARSRMFTALTRVRAWVDIDGTYDLGPGPRYSQGLAETRYELSRCISCGCCLEVCPQVNDKTSFIGAAPISQARLFNLHPSGAMHKSERLKALMEPGGIADCGNAQNCVKACPKEIPLTTSISEMFRETTKEAVVSLFRK